MSIKRKLAKVIPLAPYLSKRRKDAVKGAKSPVRAENLRRVEEKALEAIVSSLNHIEREVILSFYSFRGSPEAINALASRLDISVSEALRVKESALRKLGTPPATA